MSQRIQRSRAKGWRMPISAVYVGRQSRWGNPWTLAVVNAHAPRPDGTPWDMEDILRWYRAHAVSMVSNNPTWLDPLRGRDLACWCPLDAPCHADVLLQLIGE